MNAAYRRTFLTLALGVCITSGFFVLPAAAQESEFVEKFKGGERAPSFILKDIAGVMKTLSSYRGHFILLHFWAPWNEGTDEELEALKKVMREVGDPEHFIVVTIARGESKDEVVNMIKKHDIWFPVLLDPKSQVRKKYHVQQLPQTLLIDPEGTLVNFPDPQNGFPVVRVVGVRDWGSKVSVEYFKELVSGIKH